MGGSFEPPTHPNFFARGIFHCRGSRAFRHSRQVLLDYAAVDPTRTFSRLSERNIRDCGWCRNSHSAHQEVGGNRAHRASRRGVSSQYPDAVERRLVECIGMVHRDPVLSSSASAAADRLDLSINYTGNAFSDVDCRRTLLKKMEEQSLLHFPW